MEIQPRPTLQESSAMTESAKTKKSGKPNDNAKGKDVGPGLSLEETGPSAWRGLGAALPRNTAVVRGTCRGRRTRRRGRRERWGPTGGVTGRQTRGCHVRLSRANAALLYFRPQRSTEKGRRSKTCRSQQLLFGVKAFSVSCRSPFHSVGPSGCAHECSDECVHIAVPFLWAGP